MIKNNLALARSGTENYTLPIVPMTQTERAELLHTMGLSAAKRGDIAMAKTLFRDAVSTHPQLFEAANRSLNALKTAKTEDAMTLPFIEAAVFFRSFW